MNVWFMLFEKGVTWAPIYIILFQLLMSIIIVFLESKCRCDGGDGS